MKLCQQVTELENFEILLQFLLYTIFTIIYCKNVQLWVQVFWLVVGCIFSSSLDFDDSTLSQNSSSDEMYVISSSELEVSSIFSQISLSVVIRCFLRWRTERNRLFRYFTGSISLLKLPTVLFFRLYRHFLGSLFHGN